MIFKPSPCRTRWEGLLVCAWLALIELLLVLWALNRPVDWVKFVFVLLAAANPPLLLYWAYRTWATFTLEYWVDRNAVTLHWANVRQIIPTQSIAQIVLGGVFGTATPGWRHWPGPYIRTADRNDPRAVTFAATRPPHECLVIEAGSARFALSPADPDGFTAALQGRYRMGPTRTVQMQQVRTSYAERIFGQDRIGLLLLAGGLAGVLVLAGVLMVRFPSLPETMVFHYNSEGLPDVLRHKSALFLLPLVGLLAWLINGAGGVWMALRKQQTGAYMLWGGAVVVQVCSLLALISLMPG